MKSNSLLTYVLYGLLSLFILAAGYYACQKQKDKKEQAAREAAELEETLRDMGYASEDTIDATGSTYVNNDSATTTTKPKVSKTGIEKEPAATTKKTQTTSPTATKPSPTVVTPSASATKKSASSVKGPGTGRWAVRAGTFDYMEGARRRLEEVIKAGYLNAEISKTKEGKAAVIVFRSNDKEAAYRVVDKLEEKGIDAAVFDRSN
ncbi:MAG: SPOR domain-containing protein [Saprospiraceae bacterium]|nr:SPOR domain-containing protein [Saprospiraceae bacterium]